MEIKKISLVLLLSLIFLSNGASAFNVFKWQLCDAANVTGGSCDDYWEQFQISLGINQTQQQETVDLSGYYNSSQVDSQITTKIDEKIGNQTFVTENKLVELRDSISENYLEKDKFELYLPFLQSQINQRSSSAFDDVNLTWLIIGILAVVGLIWFFGKKNKEKSGEFNRSRQVTPTVYKKLNEAGGLESFPEKPM